MLCSKTRNFLLSRIVLFCLCVVIATTSAFAQSQEQAAARGRQFPRGTLKRLEDLPKGRFLERTSRLSPTARQRALEWLQRMDVTETDLEMLHADDEGAIFFADEFELAPVPEEIEPPSVAEAAVPVSPFPSSLIFHSRPGAPNVLYLNFTGETVTGTAWNTSLGRASIPAVAFSTDSDFSTFSDSEQQAIKRIWQRVAEDYAPFNIDVTTERPATFTTRTAHALITRNTDANGAVNPSSTAGGVAYVNVFAAGNYATYRPAWVYYNNLSGAESYIAEAVSHEIGHNMGLSHDAKTDGTSYYNGHGSGDISWGPLMGTGYNRNVSQWSKGEYYLANNTQDDLAIIAAKVSYRPDDHGNTRATATALVKTSGTNVVSTTPETDPTNSNPANKGVIETRTDVDVFSFVSGNGTISLTVKPWVSPGSTRGGNLDVLLELYDSAGVLIATNNVPNKTDATINATVSEGNYYLYVRGTGTGDPLNNPPSGYTDYASIGQYFISGYIPATGGFVPPPQAELTITDLTQTGVSTKQFTVTYTDNAAINVATLDNNDIRVTGPFGYNQTATFVSVDNVGNGTPRTATYSITPPNGSVWTDAHNGTYNVYLQGNQVGDTEGQWAAVQSLGEFVVEIPTVLYTDNLDTDNGWSFESQWAHGTPAYSGAGPKSAFTGTKIIGFNLSGNYPNNLSPAYATTPVINCENAHSLRLRFARWLRLSNGDTAQLQISTNGVNWTTIWSTSAAVMDNAWQQMEYSLPESANHCPAVQLRWGLSSNSSNNDIGWNIDDIEILGIATGPVGPQYVLNVGVSDPAGGSVNPSEGTYFAGTTVAVTATPAKHFRFVNWSGSGSGTNNPVNVLMNSNRTLQANFTAVTTTNHPTPYWWLAAHGYTQNQENAVLELGSNGMPLWQSYIAGLDPDDPESQLRLEVTPTLTPNTVALSWNSVTGRLYTVWASSNPQEGFSPIPSAIDLPASVGGMTNNIGSGDAQFYRLEVRLP